MTQVKNVWPNALDIRFEPLGGQDKIAGPVARNADPLVVLNDFVTQLGQVAPNAAERKVLRQAVEAAQATEKSL